MRRTAPARWGFSLAGLIAAQAGRVGLWGPIGFAAGAAIWLSAARDPDWRVLAAAFVAALAAAIVAGRIGAAQARPMIDRALVAVSWTAGLAAWICAGSLACEARVRMAATPMLAQEIAAAELTGWVAAVEPRAEGVRLKVLVDTIEGVTAPPRFVRVAVDRPIAPGRGFACRVSLRPPDAPLIAAGFDPQRRAYFEQIGASGFAVGRCRIRAGPPPPRWQDRVMLRIGAQRRELAEAVAPPGSGDGGGFAAAVIAGDLSLMSHDGAQTLQNSGLAHLISVSGLHMSLVAFMLFWLVVRSLALIPWLALRAPVRKIAAAVAIIFAGAYLVISGISVPAERAFVMTAVALGAILVDRPAISMRGLAAATAIVVALRPESALEAGFQMSFAATGALVALFEMRRAHAQLLPAPGLLIASLQTAMAALGGVLLTSLVAGLATDPFVAFHFQRFTVYGLVANLTAEPIVTFIIAPAAAAAALAAPFGLAEAPLAVMRWGLELVLAIGGAFADRPEAIMPLPRAPPEALACLTLGMVWAIIWVGPVRWLGGIGLAVAITLTLAAPRPVALASTDLRVVLVKVDAGQDWRMIGPPRGGDYHRRRLQEIAARHPQAASAAAPEGCLAGEVCRWRSPGGALLEHWPRGAAPAFAPSAPALPCPDLVLLAGEPGPGGRACASAPQLRLDGRGGAALFDTPEGLRLTRGRPAGYDRPWARPAITDSDE